MEGFTHSNEQKEVVLQPRESSATGASHTAKSSVVVGVVAVVVKEFLSFYPMSVNLHQ